MRALVVAIAVMVSGAAWAANKKVHKPFAYYSTGPVYSGPTVSPDISSREAYNYRSRLRAAAQNPPNFASEYRIVTWGCGTSCETGAAINLRTGRIAFFPFTICCSSSDADPDFKRVRYQPDSSLIVFTGLLNEGGEDAEHFYVLGDGEFRLISKHPLSPKTSAPGTHNISPVDPGDWIEEPLRKLGYCIRPKIQYGSYSSFDGGKSAIDLSYKCPSEANAFLEACRPRMGDDANSKCGLTLVASIQIMLREFGK